MALSLFILKLPQASSNDVVAPVAAFTHSCASPPKTIGRNVMLFAIGRRGKNAGVRLVPHRFTEDGRYRVSLGKEGPYIPISDERDLPDYLANGYSLSMSSGDEDHKPSLIHPRAVVGWK
jgi:hypothetical protein